MKMFGFYKLWNHEFQVILVFHPTVSKTHTPAVKHSKMSSSPSIAIVVLTVPLGFKNLGAVWAAMRATPTYSNTTVDEKNNTQIL